MGTWNPKTFESGEFCRVNVFLSIRIFFRLRSFEFTPDHNRSHIMAIDGCR